MMHEEYRNKVFEKKQTRHKVKKIQIKYHQLGIFQFNKISLSCFDDKRYILDEGPKHISCRHKDVN